MDGVRALVESQRPTIYIEARIEDTFTSDVEEILNRTLTVFTLAEVQELSLTLWQDVLELEAFDGLFPKELHSLKAVEYIGTKPPYTFLPIREVIIELNIYRMSSTLGPLEDNGILLQAEVIQLPSLKFEGIWESLVFDTDIRGNLIRLVTNMLKFSRALYTANGWARMNRLILLSGPPGTGKTTLCQALAQKLSIRLNRLYDETHLIQINAATLLSKFFSESAKHILQIFTAIERGCQSHPNQFTCVLIDEIESLASSRTTASNRGEVQDAIRATNALLTGFDKVKSQPNLIILCTSNMADTLDAAFTDRCGHRITVEPPSLVASYQILRDGIQELINAQIIRSEYTVPSYRDAQLAFFTEPNKPGSALIHLCKLIDASVAQDGSRTISRSARFLSQLPEVAFSRSSHLQLLQPR